MSIANELSGEIAAAMLSDQDKEESVSRTVLKDVIIEVHSTLQHLTVEARKRDRRAQAQSKPPASSASGAN